MRIKAEDRALRLEEVQGYYNRAVNASGNRRALFRQWDAQYRGSHDIYSNVTDSNGVRVPAESAIAVDNITFELIEGSIDVDIPQPSVTPAFMCEHRVRNARRIEKLIKMLLDKLPFEMYNDEQERTVKKFGCAGLNTEWDTNTVTRSTAGDVSVSVIRPHNFYPQPGVADISSCDYVFVDYVTTRAEIMRRYSLNEEAVEDAAYSAQYDTNNESEDGARDEDVVTMTVLWYRNESGDVCRFVYSGDLVLEDDDDYYSRKVKRCETCGKRAEICKLDPCKKPKYYTEKLEYDELTEDIRCSDGRVIPAMSPVIIDGEIQMEKVKEPVTAADGSQRMSDVGGIKVPQFMELELPKMRPTRLPFYKPKTLPISVRYNIRDDDSFWGVSDCKEIEEDQQRVNMLTSRIHEATIKAGAILGIPEGCEISPSSGVFDEIVRMGPGTSREQFMLWSYAVDITQWIVERENAKESAKRKIGVSDAFVGQTDSRANESGYAKSLRIAQSAGRMASKRIMKQVHYADVFRVIFELYLAFADEPRAIYHESNDCLIAAEDRFNRNDFYEFDVMTGEWYISDDYTFAVDLNGAVEQQYPQMWELVKADFASGMYGDTSQIDTALMAWKHLEELKYPFARNVVESLKDLREKMMQAQAMPQGKPAAVGENNGNEVAEK